MQRVRLESEVTDKELKEQRLLRCRVDSLRSLWTSSVRLCACAPAELAKKGITRLIHILFQGGVNGSRDCNS